MQTLQFLSKHRMVSMQVLSVADRWFEPRSGKPTDYVIGMCWFSAKHAALKEKNQRLVGSESG